MPKTDHERIVGNTRRSKIRTVHNIGRRFLVGDPFVPELHVPHSTFFPGNHFEHVVWRHRSGVACCRACNLVHQFFHSRAEIRILI